MNDLPLSALSRGCGQFVPCEGQRNGRLDVCFTPEDYHIWKAHGPLLRLSTSGSVLTGLEPTLPKTFSTRRGALLLYSQGLVTWKTCPSHFYDGKDYGQCSAQIVLQGEQQRSTENTSGLDRNLGLPTTTIPTLYHLQVPDSGKCFGTLLCQEAPTSKQHVQIQPLSLSAERFSVQQASQQAEERRRRKQDVHFPALTTGSNPQTLDHFWDNTEAHYSENGPRTRVKQCGIAETSGFSGAINSQPSNTNSKYKRSDKTSSTHPNGTSRYELKLKLNKESKLAPGAFLPPLKPEQSVLVSDHDPHLSNRRAEELQTDHLPPIDESGGLSHKPQDNKSVKNTGRLQRPVFLPHLAPEKSEELNIQKQRKQKFVDEQKHETLSQNVREGQFCDNTINISFNTEECSAPFGLVNGKRGPGHQSSLAFLQKMSAEPNDCSDREVVRGLLPLELRDLNGQAVGSLILGPDGEIIQLSMFDNIQNSSPGQALEVLSAKGEKLPWVVVLQPEHQLTAENKEKVLQRFNVQTDDFFSELSDLQRSQVVDPVETKARSEGMDSAALNYTKSVIKTSIKNPIEGVENTVPNSSNLDETEVKKRSRDDTRSTITEERGGGHLSHLQQQDTVTSNPNEMPAHDISQNDAATSQNTDKDSEKITKLRTEKRGTEERPVTNREKITKDTKSAPERQSASSKQKDERMTKSGQNRDKTLAANTTKRVRSKETKTRDVKKANDAKSHYQDPAEEASSERSQKKRKGKLTSKDIKSEETPAQWTSPAINSSQNIEEEINKHRRGDLSDKQNHGAKSDLSRDGTDSFPVTELRLKSDAHSRSVRSLRSGAGGSALKHSGSQKSMSSSGEGGTRVGTAAPLSLSRSRLSSCSTVMIPEERLMLNPTKAEVAVPEQTAVTQEENAAALEAERVQRQEEERMRREREEEQKRQQQREELEQKMKNELQNERQRRADEIRLKKKAEEEETRRREEEDQRREQRLQEQREREIRRQQERKRQMEHFQKKREEEEQRRKAEMERLQLLEENKLQEEKLKLQDMTESERAEYLRKKLEEEDIRQREEDERRKREEEAALLAAEKAKIEEELLAREMALLHQRLSFKRGLIVESEGLEKSQGISRPWTYSYFTLLQMLGLSSARVPHT